MFKIRVDEDFLLFMFEKFIRSRSHIVLAISGRYESRIQTSAIYRCSKTQNRHGEQK